MPRPQPLQNIASGHAFFDHQYQILTPRTPFSRAGQAEEAESNYQTEQYDEDDLGTYDLQTEPLLVSSTDEGFPLTGIRDPTSNRPRPRRTENQKLTAIPVYRFTRLYLGGCLSLILLILTIASFWYPDIMLRIIGSGYQGYSNSSSESVDPSDSLPNPNLISYENYTQFPLLPSQYALECHKLMGGFMHHGEYWAEESKDVYHPIQNKPGGSNVCSGTITYQLGGQVGLAADLGLMAQVAGLAREVCDTLTSYIVRANEYSAQ